MRRSRNQDCDAEQAARALTHGFYEWEAWGRGWLQAPEPIQLEPPLTFPGWHRQAPTIRDDTRRPHWLKRLWYLGTSASNAGARTGEEQGLSPAVLKPAPPTPDLVEVAVLPTPTSRFSRALGSSWLGWLSALESPLSFELLRLGGETTIRLAYGSGDHTLIASSLRAVAPEVVLQPATSLRELWHRVSETAAEERSTTGFEFALAREFFYPLETSRSAVIEGLITVFDQLESEESAVWQVLTTPTRQNWGAVLPYAALGPTGHPVLADRPNLVEAAARKAAAGLFAVSTRLLLAGPDQARLFEIAAAASGALQALSGANQLIPLSDVDCETLQPNVLARVSRRLGMILSDSELAGLLSLPERARELPGLKLWSARAELPRAREGVVLGQVGGQDLRLTIPDRLRHLHVIGSTGSGKSNLLLSLITQDLEAGQGLCLIDPHGDLAEAVIERIPEARIKDTALIEPGTRTGNEPDAPVVGWNVLYAANESEREVLASDLVSVFRRLSTSWGDQMTTVLANAVLALLDSTRPATLLELRRFLHDERFRSEWLGNVTDPYLRSFWQHEWPGLVPRKPQVPILTRLDSLLRHRRVRETLCSQDQPLDFRALLDHSGILIAKLSQGQLGKTNASLLGSLLVTRLYQSALSRAELPDQERAPFFLYVDEFHEVATPSMQALFSGLRKYGVGLTVAHHDFYQLKRSGEGLERSVLTNTYTRLAFHVDEEDAARLERGFAHHTREDLTRLPIGEAIVRLGRADLDFRLDVPLIKRLPEAQALKRANLVRAGSLSRFGSRSVPAPPAHKSGEETKRCEPVEATTQPGHSVPVSLSSPSEATSPSPSPVEDQVFIPAPSSEGRGGPEHRYLQSLVRASAQERGYRAELEVELDSGGRVDLVITPEGGEGGEAQAASRIAVEISVTTSVEHELQNARKCLAENFTHVALISPQARFRLALQAALAELSAGERARVAVYAPEEFLSWLSALPRSKNLVAGYVVRTQAAEASGESLEARRARLNQVIAGSLTRVRAQEKKSGK